MSTENEEVMYLSTENKENADMAIQPSATPHQSAKLTASPRVEAENLSTGDLLKAKQRKFCEQYIIDYNGTRAAIDAGYKKESAAAQASRLLRNANVLGYIRELEEQFNKERSFLSKERVIRETWETYQKSISAEPVMEWDYKEHKMVPVEGEYQFDGKTATKCLEILSKQLGAFTDTVAIKNAEGKNGEKEGFKLIVEVADGEDT